MKIALMNKYKIMEMNKLNTGIRFGYAHIFLSYAKINGASINQWRPGGRQCMKDENLVFIRGENDDSIDVRW